jgi:hypothetical protein
MYFCRGVNLLLERMQKCCHLVFDNNNWRSCSDHLAAFFLFLLLQTKYDWRHVKWQIRLLEIKKKKKRSERTTVIKMYDKKWTELDSFAKISFSLTWRNIGCLFKFLLRVGVEESIVNTPHIKDDGSDVTSLFALFVFLLFRLTCSAFTDDSSTPTLTINLNEHPILIQQQS